MEYNIETLGGVNYVVMRDVGYIRQIPMEAFATWGTLLGHTDPGDTLEAILRYEEPQNGENIWGGLFEAVGEALDEMSQAGVPPEFAEDLLQDSNAPLPTKPARAKLDQVRSDSAEAIRGSTGVIPVNLDLDTLKIELVENHGQEIQQSKVSFVDNLQPVYEVKPPPGQVY